MAKKTYSDAEKAEYWKKRAQSGTSRGSSSSRGKGNRSRAKKRDEKPRKKLSGCKYEESYTRKDGTVVHRPKIWGWRKTKKFGFQKFTAYLDKNDGKPRNGTSTDVCRVFVVNLTTEGVGKQVLTGVWNMQHKKLSMTDAGLVANPHAPNGGYFGRGGSRYKDKVK